MTTIPTLTTERLVLRAFVQRDIDEYAAIIGDPEVTKYLGNGIPLSRGEAWRQMAMILGHWRLLGYGLWAVEEKATGALMGRIGCQQPDGFPGFELAYTLGRQFWRRGFAREGAAAALAYARNVLGRTNVISVIRPANAGSIRVAQSLGAVLDTEIDFYAAPSLVYRYG
ncbi:MAG TPA: GNAT family N-acetyltransferase [Gemmatimonadaceae bacterium]|nr:GNAT family N-acetyltransferase [Gemmatimonadaceae bacterium]